MTSRARSAANRSSTPPERAPRRSRARSDSSGISRLPVGSRLRGTRSTTSSGAGNRRRFPSWQPRSAQAPSDTLSPASRHTPRSRFPLVSTPGAGEVGTPLHWARADGQGKWGACRPWTRMASITSEEVVHWWSCGLAKPASRSPSRLTAYPSGAGGDSNADVIDPGVSLAGRPRTAKGRFIPKGDSSRPSRADA